MKSRKIKLSPIIIVICSAVVLAASLLTVYGVAKHDSEDNEFRRSSKMSTAVCLDKEEYTIDENGRAVVYYRLLVEFEGAHGSVTTEINSDDPSFASVDVNSSFDVYYQPDDPYNCRPVFTFPNRTGMYIFLAVLSLISLVLIVLNMITIIRNINGYQPVYERPEDIGTLGDINADSGLSDTSRDYSGTNPANDKLMDSYADPFATYTGYEEGGAPENLSGGYFDPNAGYSEPLPDDNTIPQEQYDLNNPFVSAAQGQTPFGGTAQYNEPYLMQAADPSLNDTSVSNVGGKQFGERVEQDPDDLFMRHGTDLNDPFVPVNSSDPFTGR